MADARKYAQCPGSPANAVPGIRQRIKELVRLGTGLSVREADLDGLAHWVTERAGALALRGAVGIENYGRLLAEDSAEGRRERELLTVRFSTGESYFFRDQGQFDLLAGTILPELIERRANGRTLRLWSAGCACGEEPYSLAMLVDELAPRLAGWNVMILGTDINTEAMGKARRGDYRAWSFRALDAPRRQRYFEPHGDQWRIDPRLRDAVTFRKVDLVRDRFPDPEAGLNEFDLILCRNVFIYLDAHAVGRITAKFAQTLADGGYLVTGHSELFGHDIAPLRVRMYAQSAVFKKTAEPDAAAGLAQALAQVQVAVVPLPAFGIEPQGPRVRQPAASSIPPATVPAADCDQLMQTAWRHADRGMPDQAEQACSAAIALAGFDPRPYFLLAQLAQERGDALQAKTLLNKAIYLDPSFIAAYLELGTLHAESGDSGRARRMYETVRTALAKLPAQKVIPPYGESTAADILAYVDRLLGAPGGQVPSSTTGAQLRQTG